IEFLRFFRKWSNMWSNRFYRGFCERAECRISQCFQGLSAFFVFSESVVGVLLPNQARYQLRYIPIYSIKKFYSSCPLRFLLPLPHRASQKICSRSATAATPYSSLYHPTGCARKRPQLRYITIFSCALILYQKNISVSSP
ncbi:MAG: hypothetical protein IKL59_07730, partial [Clostridia bacterium]|nr:hypothetical protein [Clostridia bacterium]